MAHRTSLVLLLGVCFMTSPAPAADEAIVTVGTVEGITEYRLPNGFRVLLFADPSKPLVTINCTIFCGSRHEGYGETGMAHLLEHMVFKGTPTFPEVPKALRDHGARFNGTTWVDRTNYFETMPATDENLEFGIKLEADRLVRSHVKREDLLSEMTVVRNEFEMGENSPEAILSQRMMAIAYEWHNYGKSTIGNRTDIERVPIDNLKAFYQKFYQPDNAMLVVAGKFDEKKALEYVVKYFGSLKKPDRKLTNTYTEEPAQDGERQVTLRRVGSVGATGVLYHIPAAAHPDYPAAEILEDCLTTEPAGRVYKALVESKKASSINGTAFGWHDPGVIEIGAKVESATGVEAARDALIETLEGVARNPITAEEVERSKQRFRKLHEQLVSSSDRLAVRLSESAGAGDWRLFFLHRDRIEAVTAEDVNRVATKYLVRNNRTVGVFLPTEKADRATIPETPNLAKLLDGYKGRADVAAGEAFDPTPETIEKRVTRGTAGSLKTAFLTKKTRGAMADVRLTLRFGNEQSLTGKTTAADLIGDMLSRGTTSKTHQEFNDALNKLGARVSFGSQPGAVTVSIKSKRDNLPAVLALVGDALRHPAFAEAEFTLLKRERLEQLAAQKTEPTALAGRALQRKLYDYPKEDIRYVPTIPEMIARMESTTIGPIKDLYESQVSAQVGELVAVGDFDPAILTTWASTTLSDWKSAVPYKRIDKPAKPIASGGTEVIQTPDKANAVYLAGITAPMNDSDPAYSAMQVGNYLLGGAPLASRLSNRVRGEKGLSYGVGSNFQADPLDKRSAIQVFAITNPLNMDKVDATIAEEVDKFLKEGVSLDELEAGKKAYVDSMRVQRSEDGTLAMQLANGLFLGRTFDYYADLEKKIETLTPAEIQKAWKTVLDPKKLIIIQAGDFKKK